jgi:hypothetical protein
MKLNITLGSILIFLCAITTSAQDKTTADMPKNTETKKFIELLAGTWKLERIVDEEKGNKATANSPETKSNEQKKTPATNTDQSRNAMQMLEFDPDARYKVNNSTTAIDSGSYRLNEQHGILYMESDSDDITPTEWAITLQKNRLTLAGRGENSDSRYKYVYQKDKEKLSTN